MAVEINGVIYDTDPVPATSRYNQSAIYLGEAGPRGDPGATGATGASGPAGSTGPPGASGPSGATGPEGASGATGATGATGVEGVSAYQLWLDAGNTGSINDFLSQFQSGIYRYVQMTPSSFWDIHHTLGRYAAVTVVDSAGTMVEGDVAYVSTSQVTISFSAAFSGEAYLT